MNRFKKELNKRGYKMEKDYDSMPYESWDGTTLDAIVISAASVTYTRYYTAIVLYTEFDRQMKAHTLCD